MKECMLKGEVNNGQRGMQHTFPLSFLYILTNIYSFRHLRIMRNGVSLGKKVFLK